MLIFRYSPQSDHSPSHFLPLPSHNPLSHYLLLHSFLPYAFSPHVARSTLCLVTGDRCLSTNKYSVPAVVYTLKTGELTLFSRKKAVTGGGGGGAPTVMSGTVISYLSGKANLGVSIAGVVGGARGKIGYSHKNTNHRFSSCPICGTFDFVEPQKSVL